MGDSWDDIFDNKEEESNKFVEELENLSENKTEKKINFNVDKSIKLNEYKEISLEELKKEFENLKIEKNQSQIADIRNRILVYDIECDSKGYAIQNAEKHKLVMSGFYSYKTNKKYYFKEGQIEEIKYLISQHDFVAGFNNHNYDDVVYEAYNIFFIDEQIYENRSRYNNRKYKVIGTDKEIISIDLYKTVQNKKNVTTTLPSAGGKRLDDVLMNFTLADVVKTIGLVTEEEGKMKFNYDILSKPNLTKEDIDYIFTYLERDIEITEKLMTFFLDFYDSFKIFLYNDYIESGDYINDKVAELSYNATCRSLKLFPEKQKDLEHVDYGGGYVAYPSVEKYVDEHIYCLDYNSLYPHIFIQGNLFSRIKDPVLIKKYNEFMKYSGNETFDDNFNLNPSKKLKEKFDKLKNSENVWHGDGTWNIAGYYDSKNMSPTGKLLVKWYYMRLFFKRKYLNEDGETKSFSEIKDETKKIRVINEEDPTDLEIKEIEITDEIRKQYLDLYEEGVDKREYTVKIFINTIYGLTGKELYKQVYDPVVAADCTRLARQWTKSARKVFDEHGYKILYTDSVVGDSMITIKDEKNNIQYIKIEELFNFEGIETREGDKIYKYFENLESLTMTEDFKIVWKPLKYVMKHYIEDEIVSIDSGAQHKLKTTKDHSFIYYDNKKKKLIEKKPTENDLNKIIVNNGVTDKFKNTKFNKAAEMFGFWIGDGSYKKDYFISFAAGLDAQEFKEKVLEHIVEFKNNVLNYTKTGDFDISNIKVRKWMKELGFKGNSKTKRIPKYVFSQNLSYKCSFIKGMFSADGSVYGKNGDIKYNSVNKNLIMDLKLLLESIGLSCSIFKERNENTYNGVPSGTYTYTLRIHSKNKEYFKNNIGFIFARKQDKIKIPKYNRNVSCKKILKKENEYFKGFVYDIEVGGTHKFFANDVLVHNTDSVYLVDVFRDKQKMLEVKDKVINKIFDTTPFPQQTFDMGIDDEISAMFFFKQMGTLNEEKKGDIYMDYIDEINKPKGFMKKNYIYVAKKKDKKTGEIKKVIKFKNLGLVKRNTTKLYKTIFKEKIEKEILEKNNCKFSQDKLERWVDEYLKKDLFWVAKRFNVAPYEEYVRQQKANLKARNLDYTEPTGMTAQISKEYGEGVHWMIPNNSGFGIGKNPKNKYLPYDEFLKLVGDKDFTRFVNVEPVLKELDYFKGEEVSSIDDFL